AASERPPRRGRLSAGTSVPAFFSRRRPRAWLFDLDRRQAAPLQRTVQPGEVDLQDFFPCGECLAHVLAVKGPAGQGVGRWSRVGALDRRLESGENGRETAQRRLRIPSFAEELFRRRRPGRTCHGLELLVEGRKLLCGAPRRL